MSKKLLLLALSLISAVIFGTPGQTYAVAGADFRAGRIADDVVYFSPNTMSPEHIQAFFNAKVPVCDTMHAGSGANQPPFTCLRDFHQVTTNKSPEAGLCNGHTAGDKSAAHIVYEVAQSCGINPQVLIVLLQKEQSLVTDTWPWSNQYRSATGYGCPDTAPCDAEYYGFFNQVYAAARQFRYYAKNPDLFNYRTGRNNNIQYNPNAGCGSTPVYIQNQATAGLYNYTPYQPNAAALNNLYGTGDGCSAYGNRNFWRMFNDWFGTPVIGATPSPLYKSSSTQSIYVIAGGKKYHVPSYPVMVNYGLHNHNAQTVETSFLDSYANGGTLTNLGKKESDPSGTIYFFDDGKRYPVDINNCAKLPNGTAIPNTNWALDCFNASVSKTLSNELVDLYTTQDIQLPQVILYQNAAWKLEGGKKRRITNAAFVDVLGGWYNTRWMKDWNASQPEGKLLIINNSVVKFSGDGTLYLFNNEQLRPIQSLQQYFAWNLYKQPTYDFPASYNSDPHTVGSALQYCTRTSSGEYFLLTPERNKVSLSGHDSHWNTATCSTGLDFPLLITPQRGNTGLYRSENGTIFTVGGQKKFAFPTADDFFQLGFHAEHIINVAQDTENSLTYGGLNLAHGRLFKVSGNDTVRLVQGGTSLTVSSTTFPGLPYHKLIVVDATTGARYPIVGAYNP